MVISGNWKKYEPKSAIHSDEVDKTMFHIMRERAETNLEKVLLSPPSSEHPRYEGALKNFYASCIDDYGKLQFQFSFDTSRLWY